HGELTVAGDLDQRNLIIHLADDVLDVARATRTVHIGGLDDLFLTVDRHGDLTGLGRVIGLGLLLRVRVLLRALVLAGVLLLSILIGVLILLVLTGLDRKSTRLNSSHVSI